MTVSPIVVNEDAFPGMLSPGTFARMEGALDTPTFRIAQNAVTQVKAFDDALNATGLVITKLDGTAKGGVVAALAHLRGKTPIPVRFIGVGEGLADLRPFVAKEFVEALLGEEKGVRPEA